MAREQVNVNNRWERFFLWLWRANGLLLFLLGVVGLAGACILVVNLIRLSSRDRPHQQLTRVAGTDLVAKDLRLAEFHAIAGTGYLYAQLATPAEYGGLSSGGASGTAHNLLFFDTSTRNAHWLLPGNDQTIPSFSFLMDPPRARHMYNDGEAAERGQVALAVLVEIKEQSSDSRSRRARTLAVASADGRGLTTVVNSIDGLLGYHQMGKDSVLVFYASDGAAKVLDLDPVARRVRSDELLSTQ